jgi:RNA-binding protein YlmH
VIVLPGDKGAHIILRKIDSAADAIVSFLKNVRSVPVNVEKLPLQLVYRRPGTIKEMVVVEASARLDAVGKFDVLFSFVIS